MAGLDIQFKKIAQVPGGGVAQLAGAIDGNTILEFQGALDDIQKSGVTKLVLDFSQVKYVNSTGLGSLVKYADTFRQSGGGVALMRVPAKVKIVIEMLGLNAFFEMCTNQEEALGSLEKTAGPAKPTNLTPPPKQAPRAKSSRMSAPTTGAPLPPLSGMTPPTMGAPTPPPLTAPAPTSGGSALAVVCSSCNLEMDIPSPGNYQCPRCFTIISLPPSGQPTFHAPNGVQPITMVLNCTPVCTEAFKEFLSTLARKAGMAEGIVQGMEQMAMEIGDIMFQHVYGGNPAGSYHVLIDANNSKFHMRLSDYGKSISANLVGSLFRKTQQVMNEFRCTPHARGGNIIFLSRSK